MRIDEITINIPITIDLDGDKPRVNVAGKDATDDEDMDQNPVMMNPLQQELELKKAEQGKQSPSIDKMLDDDEEGDEEDTDQEANLDNLKTLAGVSNKIVR
jgi:hypothetical protein